MSQSPPPDAGALGTLSHYRLDDRLGAGGMGTVYRGVDRRTGVTVAIKVIHDHLQRDANFRERFKREAHVASLLTSPYSVRVLDFGTDQGRTFMVSEFVDGAKLTDRLRGGRLPLAEALTITTQVASALEEALVRGVVHRDIKPDNILLTREGDVKVADFGVSVLVYESGLTMPGLFVGTAAYAAPEQHHGQADVRTDIYALGVTLYQMVTGELPFSAPSPTGLMRLHQEAPVPVERLAGLPAHVVAVIQRCLAKAPEQRYQRPAELVAALHEAMQELGYATGSRRGLAPTSGGPTTVSAPATGAASGPISGPVPTGSQPGLAAPAPPPSRRPLLIAIFGTATALVVCVTLGLVGYTAFQDQQARAATATAQVQQTAVAASTATAVTQAGNATATVVTAQATQVAATVQAAGTASAIQAATAVAQATVAAQSAQATAQAAQAAATAQAAQAAAATAAAKPASKPPAEPIKPGDVNALIPQLTGERAIFRNDGGELAQTTERVSLLAAKVNLSNVAAQATFFTPDQPKWDYGMVIRETNNPRRHYRVIILSTGEWRVVLGEFGASDPKFTTVRSGRLTNLKTAANESNILGVIALGNTAYVYVNSQQIATVNIGEHTVAGDVWIATGFYRDNAVPGNATRYGDYKVWELP